MTLIPLKLISSPNRVWKTLSVRCISQFTYTQTSPAYSNFTHGAYYSTILYRWQDTCFYKKLTREIRILWFFSLYLSDSSCFIHFLSSFGNTNLLSKRSSKHFYLRSSLRLKFILLRHLHRSINYFLLCLWLYLNHIL